MLLLALDRFRKAVFACLVLHPANTEGQISAARGSSWRSFVLDVDCVTRGLLEMHARAVAKACSAEPRSGGASAGCGGRGPWLGAVALRALSALAHASTMSMPPSTGPLLGSPQASKAACPAAASAVMKAACLMSMFASQYESRAAALERRCTAWQSLPEA